MAVLNSEAPYLSKMRLPLVNDVHLHLKGEGSADVPDIRNLSSRNPRTYSSQLGDSFR